MMKTLQTKGCTWGELQISFLGQEHCLLFTSLLERLKACHRPLIQRRDLTPLDWWRGDSSNAWMLHSALAMARAAKSWRPTYRNFRVGARLLSRWFPQDTMGKHWFVEVRGDFPSHLLISIRVKAPTSTAQVEFFQLFNMGYQNYSQGEWQVARRMLLGSQVTAFFDLGPWLANDLPHQIGCYAHCNLQRDVEK